jgi:DNA-directed RNA polymerase specialized sigma24 family protein
MAKTVLSATDLPALTRQLRDGLEGQPVTWRDLERYSAAAKEVREASPPGRVAALERVQGIVADISPEASPIFGKMLEVYGQLSPDRQSLVRDPLGAIRELLLDRVLSGYAIPAVERDRSPQPPTIALGEEHRAATDHSTPAAEVACTLTMWIETFPWEVQQRVALDLLTVLVERTPESERESRLIADDALAVCRTEAAEGLGSDNQFPDLGESGSLSDVCEAARHLVVFLRGPTFEDDVREIGDRDSLQDGLVELLSAEGRRAGESFSGVGRSKKIDAACAAIEGIGRNLVSRISQLVGVPAAAETHTAPEQVPVAERELTEIGSALREGLAGDDDRLDQFFRLARELCFDRACRRLKDSDAAEDVAQTVMFRISQRIEADPQGLDPQRIVGYLLRATWNECVNAFDKRVNARETAASAFDRDARGGEFLSSIAQPTQREVEIGAETILQLLKTAPGANCETLVFWLENDFNVEATASHFGISAGTVYVRLSRARHEAQEIVRALREE